MIERKQSGIKYFTVLISLLRDRSGFLEEVLSDELYRLLNGDRFVYKSNNTTDVDAPSSASRRLHR